MCQGPSPANPREEGDQNRNKEKCSSNNVISGRGGEERGEGERESERKRRDREIEERERGEREKERREREEGRGREREEREREGGEERERERQTHPSFQWHEATAHKAWHSRSWQAEITANTN